MLNDIGKVNCLYLNVEKFCYTHKLVKYIPLYVKEKLRIFRKETDNH